ncbi:hypothetical protein AVEN_216091-1 [Araneus ventricosus]|uniref:Uncharacterized protein n=1 Tax=Araneus ventricosus TaxID=182803 RepID=A0A4Y2SUD2_ARAVE|nr:hypothetical protein AVEN_216091-1 [Araneus ventricosus]
MFIFSRRVLQLTGYVLYVNYMTECLSSDEFVVKEHYAQRLPEIIPLDFSLWGYVKDIVYQTPVSNISVSKERIQLAIFTVDRKC